MARSAMRALGPDDRRRAPRYALQLPVSIYYRGQLGHGRLRDISALSASIDEDDLGLPEGARVTLKLSLYPGAVPLALDSQVVRRTESGGFCVDFIRSDLRGEQVLRAVLPRIAERRVADEESGSWSGQLELRIGAELHALIAELASAEGVDAVDWVRGLIERAARDAQRERQRIHAARPGAGHDPATCPECRRLAPRGA